MKKTLFVILLFTANQLFAQILTTAHPSILIQQGDEALIKQSLLKSQELQVIHNFIIKESDELLTKPDLKYKKNGKRLLDVSRESFRRIFFLSYSYRLTGDEKYAKRAEKEMLTVCSFSDWNPSHFLDVAEMTMGVSIGYDWTYNYLSESSRKKISDAILNNGLKPSFETKDMWWLNSEGNWNQVCNAGMLFGAIAIRDKQPEISKTIIDRSLSSVLKAMSVYEPDGTFPEGFMYWGYGTTLNVMLISAIEKLTGKDLFPINKMPGFIKSASYMLNMVGPTGKSFNFSDCNSVVSLSPAIFWMANKSHDMGLLWNEKKYIRVENNELKTDRFLPAAIIWGAGLDFNKTETPSSNFWIGQGKTPVCLMRSSWMDNNAVFVGFKLGSPFTGHAHMDVGSFVMEANGVRWASDFGMQNYNSLESKGVDLWNEKQVSQRWKVFRISLFAHNTLSFNDSDQCVNGAAKFDDFSDKPNNMWATSNISSLYADQVKAVKRTVSLVGNSFVTIKDEIETLNKLTNVRWTMLTEDEPKLLPNQNAIELTKDDKKLLIKIVSNSKIMLKTWSTTPTNDFDSPNPGTYLIGFESQLPENSKTSFEVSLLPQK
jgi:hypothetical protein